MIISIIESIATDMGLSFYHGNESFQNLVADEETLPAIYLDQPITNTYEVSQSGYTFSVYPIKLLFMYEAKLEYTTTEHDVNCIQLAEGKIREFINRCQLHVSIDKISNIDAFEFINLLDRNVSGKALNISLQVNNEDSVCV